MIASLKRSQFLQMCKFNSFKLINLTINYKKQDNSLNNKNMRLFNYRFSKLNNHKSEILY